MPETTDLTGGCFCKNIRYITKTVFDAGYCYCSICQRFSGAPAFTWFNVPEEDFMLTAGTPNEYQSSEHFTRYFCPAQYAADFCRCAAQVPGGGSSVSFSVRSLA